MGNFRFSCLECDLKGLRSCDNGDMFVGFCDNACFSTMRKMVGFFVGAVVRQGNYGGCLNCKAFSGVKCHRK